MTKLALFLLLGLLLVQYAALAKIKRDAPPANENSGQQSIENALKNLQTLIQKTFSQEQIEAFGKQMKDFGEALGEKGKELLDTANESVNKLNASQ